MHLTNKIIVDIFLFIGRGFNFRNFENGKPFAPLPELFQNNASFLQKFSEVRGAVFTINAETVKKGKFGF